MTVSDDLKARLWIDAHLRRFAQSGGFYTIIHKGDDNRGSLLLKLNLGWMKGCKILTQAYTEDGQPGWLPALDGHCVPEAQADAYIARQIERDPDLWAIELESRDGQHPFPGEIIG